MQTAIQLGRAGRLAEAAAVYQRLLQGNPAIPDAWYNLGLIQRRLGQFESALDSYQQALNNGVSQPEEVHLNRAVVLTDDLRRDDAAADELRTALRLNRNYIPAHLNLANLEEDRGNRAAATELYERILTLDPTCHEALARLANLRDRIAPDDPIIQRVKHALASQRANAADRASLGFALGRALDQSGAYAGAFAAYAAANNASRASVRSAARYDRKTVERLIDDIAVAFPQSPPAPQPASGRPPIFICGMFRSGSTLVEQVLARHPRVISGGELAALPALVGAMLTPFPSAMRTASAEKLRDLAQGYQRQVAKLFPAADLVTDKRPDNFLYVGLIKRLFPNAKIVHTTRNPLDNCLSIYFLHLDQSMSYALDLMDTGHYYKQYRRLMAHWRALFPDDILDFDYDAFVSNPRPAVERLLAFLGLDWNDGCLSPHEAKTTVKTASVWQVREPLYTRASGRWRNYATELEPLRAYLNDLAPHSS